MAKHPHIKWLGGWVMTLIVLMTTSTSGHAYDDFFFTREDYERLRNTDTMQTYIIGVGRGYEWANVRLKHKNQPPFYCRPPYLSMGIVDYDRIIHNEMEMIGKGIHMQAPLEMFLLDGLERAFPCQ
jgi:hypothetical protein